MNPNRIASARQRGLGLVEMLVALAVAGTLMTAAAVALNASFVSYQANAEQAELMQRSRITLHRLLAQVRTTREHQPVAADKIDDFVDGLVTSDTGISMLTDAGDEIAVRYDADTDQLILTDDAGADHVMLTGVQGFEIRFEPMKSPESIKTGGDYDLLKRATILLTVRAVRESNNQQIQDGAQAVTLSSSVMPRRNIW